MMAEVQETIVMMDKRKAEQIWYTYRELYRNFAIVCKELVPAGQDEVLLTGDFETESEEQYQYLDSDGKGHAVEKEKLNE